MTIGGDRPPRSGGDVVTFEDIREFLVAYSECEQQMHITNQDGTVKLRFRVGDLDLPERKKDIPVVGRKGTWLHICAHVA